jgi:ABC-type transport system involved in multi-copper enzyme maturation permease subunit
MQPVPTRCVVFLLVAAVGLPIVLCVVGGVAALLSAMGDEAGGAVLARVALGGGILWVVDLIGLLVAQAINAVARHDGEE